MEDLTASEEAALEALIRERERELDGATPSRGYRRRRGERRRGGERSPGR